MIYDHAARRHSYELLAQAHRVADLDRVVKRARREAIRDAVQVSTVMLGT